MELTQLFQALQGMDYKPCRSEQDLESQVVKRLEKKGIAFQRQYIADETARFDFMLDEGIVLELKVEGGAGALLRQIERYAQFDCVDMIIVVTTRASHRQIAGLGTVHGKRVGVIHVGWL